MQKKETGSRFSILTVSNSSAMLILKVPEYMIQLKNCTIISVISAWLNYYKLNSLGYCFDIETGVTIKKIMHKYSEGVIIYNQPENFDLKKKEISD